MAFRREQYSTLVERLLEPPRTLTFVTGPRQTGKTTLIQQALDAVRIPNHYVPVDELAPPRLANPTDIAATALVETPPSERDAQWLARVWEWARTRAADSEQGFVLALDEIQHIPDWSRLAKGLWDADRRDGRPLRVVLAGSAPMSIQQGLTESLAGRFETIRLTHWSFSEMAGAFDLSLPQYMYFGGYPKVAEYLGAEVRWRSYVRGNGTYWVTTEYEIEAFSTTCAVHIGDCWGLVIWLSHM